MKTAGLIMLFAAMALASCATTPTPGAAPAPDAEASAPAEPLDLGGNWRRSSVGDVLSAFERSVAARYAPSSDLAAASRDLRANQFDCETLSGERAEAPAQACRRTETVGDCTHTWQVHLFAAGGAASALDHARALYDRRCGGDGLLGGPG